MPSLIQDKFVFPQESVVGSLLFSLMKKDCGPLCYLPFAESTSKSVRKSQNTDFILCWCTKLTLWLVRSHFVSCITRNKPVRIIEVINAFSYCYTHASCNFLCTTFDNTYLENKLFYQSHFYYLWQILSVEITT
jgi:hypothetical protein